MGFVRKYICCGCACSKSRPQYKQHVLRVFPKAAEHEPAASQPQNLSALVHYALSYPEQLHSIGRYLHKCISRDLKQGHHNAVRVGMAALNALIDACHSDMTQLTLYDSWIIKCALLLFNHSDVQLRIIASETFRKFVHYQDEWSDYRKLDVFFDHLVALCVYEHTDQVIQCKARVAGIQSMSKMVLFTDPQNTVDHLNEIVPAIFHNIKVESERTEPEVRTVGDRGSHSSSWNQQRQEEDLSSPEALARACLRNIGTLATLNFIELILAPIFKYLDGRLWKSPEFALACIRTIADSAQVDHGYGICYLLLKHLDDVDLPRGADESKLLEVQIRIVQVMAELVLVMRLDIGPWQGLINFLVQRLEQAVDSEHDQLRDAFINCVASYCIRLPSALDIIDIIGIIVDQLPLEPKESANRHALLQCALHAARLRRYSPDQSHASDHMLSTLLNVCSPDPDSDSASQHDDFILVHEILVNLAVAFVGRARTLGGRIDSGPESSGHARAFGEPAQLSVASASKVDEFVFRLWSGSRTDDMLTMGAENSKSEAFLSEQQQRWIHISINAHMQDRACPTPDHICAYFRTLIVLLHLRPHKSLLTAVPMILSWMDAYPVPPASASPLSCAQLKASRVCVLVAAYIQAIARVHALINSRRAASLLDEIGTAALERSLEVSRDEVGLYVDAETALTHTEISVKHRHGVKGRDVHIKDGVVEHGPLFDRVEFVHALSRLQFPGLDVREAREALVVPFDTSCGGIESPRRQSLSIVPHVVLERSFSEFEPSRSRSSLPSHPSMPQVSSGTVADTDKLDIVDDEKEPRDEKAASHASVASEDVRIVMEASDSDSESADRGRRTSLSAIEETTNSRKPGRATFSELTTSYLRQHDQRLSSLQVVSGRRGEGQDADANDDETESVLSELMASSRGSRDDDSASVASLGPEPATPRSSSDASRQKSPVAFERTLSRSSVLQLPDNPQPMLSAQQMLSGLETSMSDDEHQSDDENVVAEPVVAVAPSSAPPTTRKKTRRRRHSDDRSSHDVSVFSLHYPTLNGLRDHSDDDRNRGGPASL